MRSIAWITSSPGSRSRDLRRFEPAGGPPLRRRRRRGSQGEPTRLEGRTRRRLLHAPHMEAQKRYARQLLTHLNPYTKLTYAEDPAVALVEINNENGLIHTWMGGDSMPCPTCLRKTSVNSGTSGSANAMADTAALSNAWGAHDEPLAAEMLANAKLTRGLEGWNVEQHQGAAVDSTAEGGTAILRVRKPGTADWHVQFNQTKLAIRKGAVYTVSFRAAADRRAQGDAQSPTGPRSLGEPGLGHKPEADEETATLYLYLHCHG